MSGGSPRNELSLKELLERAREVPRQPDAVRARVLARARAAAASPTIRFTGETSPRPRFRAPALSRVAVAALVAGVAGTVYAFSGGWMRPAAVAPAPLPSASQHPAKPSLPAGTPPSTAATPLPSAAPIAPSVEPSSAPRNAPEKPSNGRAGQGHGSYAAELELMRSAHTAYAARDYASALVLTSEHARRFRDGALAEQREALRIRCLLGAGRTSEAQRAVAAFKKRFPRSVLLGRLEAEVGAE